MITLKFKKPVFVSINGKKWEAKEIQTEDMKEAAEIIRLVKGGYGWDILE